ncbi:hypothetical protein [Streptomyces sp. NPDC007264]|uniref:hypothetical protein n=1 Tax=Streptomyces sp. NPDC007264 TaxID=3364777 RepID=UPI0036DF77D0
MRACYVLVRLAATVLGAAAAVGCMSVGDDAGSPSPSHSAGRHGRAPRDGAPGASGRVIGNPDGTAPKGGSPEPDASGTSGSPSVSASGPGAEGGKGRPTDKGPSRNGKGGGGTVPPPAPTDQEPTPTQTSADPSPTQEPDPSSPPPTTAEPSSSAHEQAAQMVGTRVPAPRAGEPVRGRRWPVRRSASR